MLNFEGFNQLVQALQQRGFDEATAQRYAALIGDTPEENETGQWVIRDEQGKVSGTIAPLWDKQ